ncbi:hypothetical protein PMIN03_010420 [Paraphaeosphaeria minitans]
MDVEDPSGSGQQRLIFAPGLSDDENLEDDHGLEDLFGPSPTNSKSHNPLESKKMSRRLSNHDKDDADTPEPSPTKKPRVSLFGDPFEETPPQTPGTGLGMGLSSLNLDQQVGQGDNEVNAFSPDMGATIEYSRLDDTRNYSPVCSGEEETERLDEDEVPTYMDDPIESYGLRKNINRQGAATTHIDIDQSGNYDPVDETRKRTVKPRIVRQAKQAQQNKKKQKQDYGKGKGEQKPKLIFRRKIKAIGTVLNITDNQDNWPDGHSIIDSEEEAEREELLAFSRKDTPTPTHNLGLSDPAGEYGDLTGHPAVRGCKSCRIDGNKCSMITDGDYPCQDCVDKETQCEPIINSGIFGPCNRCVEQHLPCSYENNNGEPHMAMCDECLEADSLDCKVRPPRGYKFDRIDLDRDHYGEDRKWVSCTHCREENKRCSLKKKTDKPPCKRCKKQKIGCHFYDVVAREKEKPAKKKNNPENEPTPSEKSKDSKRTLLGEISSENSIPSDDLFRPEDLGYMNADSCADESDTQDDENLEKELIEDAEGHRGFLTTIKTSFAHPMVFSVNPPGHPNAVRDCNFCYMPVFGFVGHFERDVHAIQWSNNQGYTEFGNGHREGNDATTMCYRCTFHRLQIMVCTDHIVQPIDTHEEQLDYNAAAEDLMSVEGGTPQMQYELQRDVVCGSAIAVRTSLVRSIRMI